MKLEYVYDKWGDIYKRLISQIPQGNYYDNRALIIPKKNKHYIKVTTDRVGELHYVAIVREHNLGNAKNSFTFVPTTENYWIEVRLSNGVNSICVATDKNNKDTLVVTSTYFGLMLNSYAKEIYETSSKLEGIRKDIYVDEATRLASPVLTFSKDLTENHLLRTFGLQVIVRALINYQGTMRGLENICKGLFVSTPVISDIEQKELAFDNIFAGQEYELGKLIQLWVRNPALIRRSYLIWFLHNKGESIDYSDDKVIIADGESSFTDNNITDNDTDEVLMPEDIGIDSETGEPTDDSVEQVTEIEITLPRLDRNLPIPFTTKHPWTDKKYVKREHLDSGTSLDIATMDDPFETGMLGERFIPYKYDGSKASAITKVMQFNRVPSTNVITLSIGVSRGTHILTEDRQMITTENDNEGLIVEDGFSSANF